MPFYQSTNNKPSTDIVKLKKSFCPSPLSYGQWGGGLTGLDDPGSPNSSCTGTISPQLSPWAGRLEIQSVINGTASGMVPTGHQFSQASRESVSHQAIEAGNIPIQETHPSANFSTSEQVSRESRRLQTIGKGCDDDSVEEISRAFKCLSIEDEFNVSRRPDEPKQSDHDERAIHQTFSSTRPILVQQHHEQVKSEEPIVDGMDYISLIGQNGLTCTVVDWFLHLLCSQFPNQITLMRCEVMSKLIRETSVDFLQNLVENRIFVGAFLREYHYSLVVIDQQKKVITYYDSLGEKRNEMEQIELAIRQHLNDPGYRIGTRRHIQQRDGYNCGVFCLYFAHCHFFDKDLMEETDLGAIRWKLAGLICLRRLGWSVDMLRQFVSNLGLL